jgi:hypothetical protein
MLAGDPAGLGKPSDRDLVRRQIELGQDLARQARPSRSLTAPHHSVRLSDNPRNRHRRRRLIAAHLRRGRPGEQRRDDDRAGTFAMSPKAQCLDHIRSDGGRLADSSLHSARRIGIGYSFPRFRVKFAKMSPKPIAHFESPVPIVPLEYPSIGVSPTRAKPSWPRGLRYRPPCLQEARKILWRSCRSI